MQVLTHSPSGQSYSTTNSTSLPKYSCTGKDQGTRREQETEDVENSKAKSSLCRNYLERQHCPYGAKCQFAHGLDDLRFNSHHKFYKTRLCNTFSKNDVCMYGNRCNFLHNTNTTQETPIVIQYGYREVVQACRTTRGSRLLAIMEVEKCD